MKFTILILAFLICGSIHAATEAEVRKYLFPIGDARPAELKKMGPTVMPIIAKIYSESDNTTKATLAWVMYELAWKSNEAKKVLMNDIHTKDSKLRLQVQWALGRVSADKDVVEMLLQNMQDDDNPLFRDKAACALASDQIHLNENEKYRLYEGLILGLSDSKIDVRSIAIKALEIQTGQRKGFDPYASLEERNLKINIWKQWLVKYKESIKP
jgi:HEAT repeat protein